MPALWLALERQSPITGLWGQGRGSLPRETVAEVELATQKRQGRALQTKGLVVCGNALDFSWLEHGAWHIVGAGVWGEVQGEAQLDVQGLGCRVRG